MGPSFWVTLEEGVLVYERCEEHYENRQSERIAPSEEQWAAFRAALDDIGVWRWKERYPNPGVCDGTHWALEIRCDDAETSCSGDNNYPDETGEPPDSPGPTPAFRRFLEAVQALLGGRDFC